MSTLALSRLLTIALCVLFLCTGCPRNNQNSIVIAGSTSVEPFAERLAELYAARQRRQAKGTPKPAPETEINVQGGGSSAGIRAVQSGICQIGMSSRALTAEEKGLHEIPIALDAIVIVVNRDNPVRSITIEQARGIFSGHIRSWHELGGPRRPITVITREDGSGTRASFEEKVMREIPNPKSQIPNPAADRTFARDALVQDSNGAVREIVAGDLAAFGYISFGLVDERVRALELDGVAPSESTIKSGTYQIWRKFLFLTKEAPAGPVKDFIDYALSPEGQQVLADEGLVRIQ